MAYLDDTGLAYFWGKIKAWANSVFALLGHTHPASDVTLMTGYSKPASGSAIAASDSLNQAVGKLEAKVDDALDDSGYVHKTGDELVQGIKTFSNDHSWRSDISEHLSSIQIQSPVLDRLIDPERSTYVGIIFLDKNSSVDLDYTSRLGGVEFVKNPASSIAKCGAYLKLYNPTTTTRSADTFGIAYDQDDRFYAFAPSTSELRTAETDILTRNWIPKDTRIVHTTGNEHISGNKYFDNGTYFANGIASIRWARTDVSFTASDYTVPSSTVYNGIALYDATGNAVGYDYFRVQPSGNFAKVWSICNSDCTVSKYFVYGYNKVSNSFYLDGPADFSSSDNSTKIPNTAWIRDATGDFACNAATTTKLKTARTIAISGGATGTATSFDGSADITIPVTALDVSKASTGTLAVARGGTGAATLDDAGIVTKTGGQTISGAKTFASSITIERANPYVFFIETDQTRWNSGGTSYQGLYFRDKNSDNLAQITVLNQIDYTELRFMTYANKGTTIDGSYIGIWGGNGSSVKYLSPFSTKTFSLGDPNHLFTDVYCNSAAINTSDEKVKTSISEIPDEVLDAWSDVSFLSFQFTDAVEKKGASARIHSGLVSQRIDAAFKARGIDGFRWGFLCRDQGDAVDRDEKQPDGTIRHFHEDAFDNWGVRYVEALCMEAAYQRRENSRLKKRVADLEERLAALELKVS